MQGVYGGVWTEEELVALEKALEDYPADRHPPVERYVLVAAQLNRKSVRNVAIRAKWLANCKADKRRKGLDDGKRQLRRERGQSIFAVQPKISPAGGVSGPAPLVGGPLPQGPHPQLTALAPQPQLNPAVAFIPGVEDLNVAGNPHHPAGGPVQMLLQQNYVILNQFKQNMAHYLVHENTELLVRFRDNILAILNHMNSMQGVMSQMPPLPVRMNVELANNFLPKSPTGGLFVPAIPLVPGVPASQMPIQPPVVASGPPLSAMNGGAGTSSGGIPILPAPAPASAAAGPVPTPASVAPVTMPLPLPITSSGNLDLKPLPGQLMPPKLPLHGAPQNGTKAAAAAAAAKGGGGAAGAEKSAVKEEPGSKKVAVKAEPS